MEFETVIGLEVHVQLSTSSKIFCGCPTSFGVEANTQTCPVCSGMPGALPVLNRKVVEYAIKAGLALNCEIADRSEFARKNYFYPDLPKGYQTSQSNKPICFDGYIDIELEDGKTKRIGITRAHMEEDAGKSIHGENMGSSNASYVDLNRSCVPLIEIVSEPDMRSSYDAKAYLQKLRNILLYLEISDCSMEEGSMRCDANVSIRPVGQKEYGTRAEVKNMNSFRNVQRAIDYEVARQKEIILSGKEVDQETRLYDVDKGVTFSMRGKEDAHDYRYFPCPDIPPIVTLTGEVERLKGTLPELPDAKKARFIDKFNLSVYDASLLTSDKDYADYFEEALKQGGNPKNVANWIITELLREVNEKQCNIFDTKVSPAQLCDVVMMIDEGLINGKTGKDLLSHIRKTEKDPRLLVEEMGLAQVSDIDHLEEVVSRILENNPAEALRFKDGDKKLQGFFVGQIMKETGGKANPKLVNQLLAKMVTQD